MITKYSIDDVLNLTEDNTDWKVVRITICSDHTTNYMLRNISGKELGMWWENTEQKVSDTMVKK